MPLITALAGSQGSECGISLNNQDCRIKTRRQEQRGHAAAICAAAVVGGSGRGGCAGGARPPAPRAPSPRLCHGHPAPDAGSWGNGSQKIPEQPPPGAWSCSSLPKPRSSSGIWPTPVAPLFLAIVFPRQSPRPASKGVSPGVSPGVTGCHRSAGSDWHLVTWRGGGTRPGLSSGLSRGSSTAAESALWKGAARGCRCRATPKAERGKAGSVLPWSRADFSENPSQSVRKQKDRSRARSFLSLLPSDLVNLNCPANVNTKAECSGSKAASHKQPPSSG